MIKSFFESKTYSGLSKTLLVMCFISLIFLAFKEPPRITSVAIFNSPDKAKNYILRKSSEGYSFKQIVSYVDGTNLYCEFMVIMEK